MIGQINSKYGGNLHVSFDDLRKKVEENGNVVTVSMGTLRDAHGAGKLGVHVRAAISKELAGRGLGHYPDPLPEYQEQVARIFKLGSPIADLLDAALQPNDDHDEELRQAVSGDAQEKINRIRELVCP
jgi:hypothetical protein